MTAEPVRVVEDTTGDTWDLPPNRAAELAALLASCPRTERPRPTGRRQPRPGARPVCCRCHQPTRTPHAPMQNHRDPTTGEVHPVHPGCHPHLHQPGDPTPCTRDRT